MINVLIGVRKLLGSLVMMTLLTTYFNGCFLISLRLWLCTSKLMILISLQKLDLGDTD